MPTGQKGVTRAANGAWRVLKMIWCRSPDCWQGGRTARLLSRRVLRHPRQHEPNQETEGTSLLRVVPLELLTLTVNQVPVASEELCLQTYQEILRNFEVILFASVPGESGTATCRFAPPTGPRSTVGMVPRTGGTSSFTFPPEFKARPGESWKEYWRSVEFWLASEGVNLPPAVRGSRLMQQMRERAGKILNHLTVSDVATDGGVELIKREMERSPIIRLLEHKEVDRKRQKFMKLSRYPKESLESFINRASIYRHENDQCQNYKVGTKFYLGHLLDAAKLSRKDEALIKTASQGLHDEGRVVNAMLDLAEQLEGLPGYPIGKGEPDMPDEDKYLVQKRAGENDFLPRRDDRRGRLQPGGKGSRGSRLRAKWKQVFHTIMEDIESSDGQASEPPGDEDEPDPDDGTGAEEESASGETDGRRPSGRSLCARVQGQEACQRDQADAPVLQEGSRENQGLDQGATEARTLLPLPEAGSLEPRVPSPAEEGPVDLEILACGARDVCDARTGFLRARNNGTCSPLLPRTQRVTSCSKVMFNGAGVLMGVW